MGLADEFTEEMARIVTDMEKYTRYSDPHRTEKNAFVTYFAGRGLTAFTI